VRGEASHEFVFGVVGHIGSGASQIAEQLSSVLTNAGFDVHILKARKAIVDWGTRNNRPTPSGGPNTVAHVSELQNLGDEMRRVSDDHAAVARALVTKVRAARAVATSVSMKTGEPVYPDGKRRAYILDSIRHPAEVEFLRHLYRSGFVLLGVVCDEDERLHRITEKFCDAGKDHAKTLMKRDAKAAEKWGQRVSDAFHLSDVFLDNSARRLLDDKPNPDWDVPDQLDRLVTLLTRSRVVRATPHEVAMYIAHGARMRSACLSRQVGASVVDHKGNIVATGTNEVPRAGGGVYGAVTHDDEGEDLADHRCAFTDLHEKKFCSNTREQREIIDELIETMSPFLRDSTKELANQIDVALRASRIGELLEFSRAVHAEMDAILAATRTGASIVGGRLYVTTFPCHYCARHIVAAGLDEVQYIEPYPKSRALKLHADAISVSSSSWKSPSSGGEKVLVRPFTGIAPRLYERAFLKQAELKDSAGNLVIGDLPWGDPWNVHRVSYAQLEAELARYVEE
jgi:deoxycytidylate deaminase